MKKTLLVLGLVIFLCGCAKHSPTATIAENAIKSADDAIVLINSTDNTEQCKLACTTEINVLKASIQNMLVSAQAEVKTEQERTLRWKMVSIFIGLIFAVYIIKRILR